MAVAPPILRKNGQEARSPEKLDDGLIALKIPLVLRDGSPGGAEMDGGLQALRERVVFWVLRVGQVEETFHVREVFFILLAGAFVVGKGFGADEGVGASLALSYVCHVELPGVDDAMYVLA